MSDSQRVKEWKALYADLLRVLSRYGRNDPFGDGDFFLIDDDWGSWQHKVECTTPVVFGEAVFAATQSALSGYNSAWEVVFVLSRPPESRSVCVVSRNGVSLQLSAPSSSGQGGA